MFATRAAAATTGGHQRHSQQDARQCAVPAALLKAGPGGARFNRRTENVDTMFDNMEELVGNTPSEKNWKAIAIALVVIASILSLITISIVIAEPKLFARHETQLKEPLTFTEAMTWLWQLRQLNYQWLKCQDRDLLLFQNASTGDLMQLTVEHGNGTASIGVFLSANKVSQGRIDQFVASPDCLTLLVPTKVEKVFRHSSLAQYKLIRVPASPSEQVKESVLCPERASCYSTSEPVKLQLAKWGPEGSFIAFVYQKDIYYADNPFNMAPVRITDTGRDPDVTNGIATWVYEEEILETSAALWVSPGNQRIAFLRFNDSRTPRYEMPWFGRPDSMYLHSRRISYPKAGQVGAPICNVTALVYDVKSTRTLALPRPETVPEEHYISSVRWLDPGRLLLVWQDRDQSRACVTVCRLPEGACQLIHSENTPGGWIDLMKQTSSEPIVDSDGQSLYTIMHNLGYRRIARLKTDDFGKIEWLTAASYDVADILHLDGPRRQLFFLSCREADGTCDPTKMHVHRTSVSSTGHATAVNCLTCGFRPAGGAVCEFNKAAFSPSGAHFLHECLGPEPYQYFLRLNDYPAGYPVVAPLERNEAFKALLATRRMPRPVFRRLLLRNETTEKSRADPLEVHAKLLLPEQLNETHITQYPMVLKVYGGPSVQMVTRRFEFGWQHYTASALNFITASVDGRGTGNRGSDYLFAIKNNFAKVELEDQMDALKALAGLQFVNVSSMAVFGWSYGGFLALHMLGHPFNVNNSYFSCAVAVASVTDFSYYNSGYTERYLGVKSEKSAEAYRRTNATQLVGNLWNKDLLLVHGTGDDNVHYQNTAQLVKALVQENIDFDFMTYPDDSHNLANSQMHVFQRVTTFLVDTFNQTSERRRLLRGRTHGVCHRSVGRC